MVFFFYLKHNMTEYGGLIMELSKDIRLCSATKTPRGWYVLYQADYKSPNIFNLHEKGLFKYRPHVASEMGGAPAGK